jgi:lipid-binding SYLF domain-containing protein
MKKILLLALLTLCSTLRLSAAGASGRAEAVVQIESCEAILQDFMSNPATAIPAPVLQKAKALVIVNQFKAGFFLGIKDGYGVVMVKKANGRWSLPVLVAVGELSLGFQVGADAIESVLVITDENTPKLLFNQRLNLGIDAKAVAGPKVAEAETVNKEILETPVLVYSKKKGLYAGATIRTGWLQRNDKSNFMLHHTTYTMPELLYSDWVESVDEVKPLMAYVQSIAP